ncbi:MAG: hypothetical protein AAFN93_13920 [Bacteroidota bacterium]
MSIIILLVLLVLTVIGLIVNWIFASLAFYDNGLSNLFSSIEVVIEDLFDERITTPTPEDYLIFSLIITTTIFVIFFLFLVIVIILAVVAAPEELGVAAVDVGAEAGAEAAASEGLLGDAGSNLLSGFNNLISGVIGTILLIILIILLIASVASGIFCSLAAAGLKNQDAKRSAEIASIAAFATTGLSLFAVIAYFVLRYYEYLAKKRRQEELLRLERQGYAADPILARELFLTKAIQG